MKPTFIISGEKGSGKSTLLANIVTLLQTNGYVVKGFIALHNLESDSYIIKNVETDEEYLVMKRIAGYEKRPDHFKIFQDGVEKGTTWIDEILKRSPHIAVIDEIGGYELREMLWNNSFTRLIESDIPLIFTVKTKHLNQVKTKWKIDNATIFYPGDFANYKSAFEKIKEWIQ